MDDPDTSAQIRAVIRESLAYFGISGKLADDMSAAAATRVKKVLSGKHLYVAKCSKAEREQQHQAIRAAFDGRNHQAVCRCFGISRASLFRITRPKRKASPKFELIGLLIKIKRAAQQK